MIKDDQPLSITIIKYYLLLKIDFSSDLQFLNEYDIKFRR